MAKPPPSTTEDTQPLDVGGGFRDTKGGIYKGGQTESVIDPRVSQVLSMESLQELGVHLGSKRDQLIRFFSILKQVIVKSLAEKKVASDFTRVFGPNPLLPDFKTMSEANLMYKNALGLKSISADNEKKVLSALPHLEETFMKQGFVLLKDLGEIPLVTR